MTHIGDSIEHTLSNKCFLTSQSKSPSSISSVTKRMYCKTLHSLLIIYSLLFIFNKVGETRSIVEASNMRILFCFPYISLYDLRKTMSFFSPGSLKTRTTTKRRIKKYKMKIPYLLYFCLSRIILTLITTCFMETFSKWSLLINTSVN